MRWPMLLVAWLPACSSILGFDEPRRRGDAGAAVSGTPCAPGGGDQCQSGHCVTEGATSICCDDACTDDCRSCLAANTGRADGECASVVAGQDPKDRCAESDCTTGACGANGSCGNLDDELSCGVARQCCSGACVSVRSDPDHCGTCGMSCAVDGGEICAVAECGVVDWALWPMPGAAGEPNPRSYTDNGDGTVTDAVTGLMWQKAVNANSYMFESAKAYCATTLSNVALAGHRDWRMPSRIELLSLTDHTIASPGPTIDGGAFPGTPGEMFWSSTPFAGAAANSWFVSFASGSSGFRAASESFRVRCVR